MEVGLALAAAQVGVAVADWLISPLAERAVNRALSYLGSCSSDNLKNLETDTQLVKAILRAADSRPPGDILEPWTKKLKAAYSEAEDILDVIDYHRIESRILSQKHDKSSSTASPRNTGEDINIPGESKRKLKEALGNIRNLISEGQRLLSLLNMQAGCDNINNTPSSTSATLISNTSAPPAVVFGRDVERDEIIEYLNGSPASGECYTVVGIHGIAGSGKTTLAQHVLKKEMENKDDPFEVIMWIHVTQTFSVDRILNEMLEVAGVQGHVSNHDKLQRELTEKLKGKRFFLVLDDVWYERRGVTEQKLHLILHPLKDAKIGSRILVTSRTTDVAKALGAKSNLISNIKEEEYISMFLHYALYGARLTDQASREYRSIGRRIAKKLGRSPLAATTVAAQLKNLLNTEYWTRVLTSDLWKDTMGALFWSYQQLEENVKQCFRYCSIFPRRYELERVELVRLWMAEGFVKTNSDKEDMEKVAMEYFDGLVSSSFIQRKENIYGWEVFTIHDLLHDLAEHVAGSDCFRVEKGMVGRIPPDVRHIFLDSRDPSVFKQILNLEALRTLIMPLSKRGAYITPTQFESLLSNLQKLRVLHVSLQSVKGNRLSECIGGLKHLRSFKFCSNFYGSIVLPLEFTKLYHLQVFDAHRLNALECSASEDMVNLVNLRYIICGQLSFPNIGRLSWLKTLRVFRVKKNEEGYEIHQLERLDNICGTLKIEALENVKSKEEALQAKLDNKVHISKLILDWNSESDLDGTSCDKQTEVLESLRPPFLIKSLHISGYRGRRYPSWLLKGHLDNLQRLVFKDCENIQSLPELPESLDLLKIVCCPKLKESYEKGGSSWEKIIQQNTAIKFSQSPW